MRTSSKAILGFLAGGVVFGGLAYTGISMYGTKPDITDSYELQLLRGTSKYVQAYDGPNARDALTYAGYTVNIVSESRNVKIPGYELSDLKKDIEIANKEIGTSQSPSIYKPVLNSLGNGMESFVKRNSNENLVGWGALGIISTFTSLFSFIGSFIVGIARDD